MSKYIYGDISKKVNDDIFSIGYITLAKTFIDTFVNINKSILKNKSKPLEFITYYNVYLNNYLIGGLYGTNLSKEEVIEKLDKFINEYYKHINDGNNN